MAAFGFAPQTHVYDITPVENLFIEEYMLGAPGEFVKAYLYGLKHCYYPGQGCASAGEMAKALQMEEGQLLDAFRYWQRQGLVRLVSEAPLQVEYENLKQLMGGVPAGQPQEEQAYPYREFNASLQQIFGSRLIKPEEFQRAYDWIEILGLVPEAVMMLCQYCLQKKGGRVSFNYIDKAAQTWAQENVKTYEAAEEYLRGAEAASSGAVQVLRRLGIYRLPTMEEMSLYRKWTESWGLRPDAVLAACRETTKSARPSMAYLNGILENYKGQGLRSAQDVENYQQARVNRQAQLRQVWEALGNTGSAYPAGMQNEWVRWTQELGFADDEAILIAARYCNDQGFHQVRQLTGMLERLADQGLIAAHAVRGALAQYAQASGELKEVFARAGLRRAPREDDVARYREVWLGEWNMPFELVMLAAESAAQGQARDRVHAMDSLLRRWHEQGVKSLRQAREQLQKTPEKRQEGNRRNLPGEQYIQQDYTPEQLEGVIRKL